MHISSDPWNWHERVVALVIIIGAIIVVLLIATAHAGAAPVCPTTTPRPTATPTPTTPPTAITLAGFAAEPAALCTAWRATCAAYKTLLGVRICTAWRLSCVSGAPHAGKAAGLAAPASGNLGGCGYRNRNMRYGVSCEVSDAGPGFVSGNCVYGYWFSRVSTRRTFTVGQAVSVDGCEGTGSELYAPIRISK
jgi:hypothetical protein